MAKILAVMPRSPYPPRSDGITVRINPIFEYLTQRHELDVIVACDSRPDAHAQALIASKKCHRLIEFNCPETKTIPRKIRILKGLLTPGRAPYEILREWSYALSDCVSRTVKNNNYDVILWYGGTDALSIVLKRKSFSNARIILDWIDSPSLHFSRNNQLSNSNEDGIKMRFRLHNWKKWEHSINQKVNASIYITNTDACFANPSGYKNIYIVPNGLLDDMPTHTNIDLHSNELTIGFLGHMAYEPNVNAVLRLHGIFRNLLHKHPNIKLKIIGREPVATIKKLSAPNVEITGNVESIWPHVMNTDIFAFPMTAGGGLQNKLLEAMRASKPVITTPICADGLENKGEGVLLTAESDQDFCNKISQLIHSAELRDKYGNAGRHFVKRYNWDSILPKYEAILIGTNTSTG